MSARDIRELKDIYTRPERISIQRYAATYMGPDKEREVNIPLRKFLTLREAEIKIYLGMFKQILNPNKFEDNIIIAPVQNEELLRAAVNEELDNELTVEVLLEKITDLYDTDYGFTVHIFYNVYDIPDSNGGDSENTYPHIMIMVNKNDREKMGFEIFKEQEGEVIKEGVRIKERRLQFMRPETAYIYPAFMERQPDWNKIMIYNAEWDDRQELTGLWAKDLPIPSSKYRQDIDRAVAAVLGRDTAEIMDEFAYRMANTDERSQLEIGQITAVLQMLEVPDITTVAKMLIEKWGDKRPYARQLCDSKMVKKAKRRHLKKKTLQTLEKARTWAEIIGDKDMEQEIREAIERERNC